MEVQNKKKKKNIAPSVGSGGRKVIKIIVSICAILLILLALLGYINQRATGQAILDFYYQMAVNISQQLNRTFRQEDGRGVSITSDGIYIENHEPDGAKPLTSE